MKTRIQLVEVEHIVGRNIDPTFKGDPNSFVALGGKLEYRALCQPQRLNPSTSCLYGDDSFNLQMRQLWEKTNREPAFVPCGQVILRDFIALGTSALVVYLDRGIAVVGAPVNWGMDFARWYIQQYMGRADGLEWCDGGDAFTIDVDLGSIAVEPTPGLLLASPGEDIFGHWILDYLPRLYLARQMDPSLWNCLYFGKIPRWAVHFLNAFNIDDSTIRMLPSRLLTRFPLAVMPSGVKQGFRVSQPINQIAWRYFKRYLEQSNVDTDARSPLPSAPRIFVSRRNWGARRAISNIGRLEEIAAERGYVVIRPEEYSIPAQAKIMRSARIVVGEDGSGLHNIIFAEPECTLGVISVPDRVNLWHLAMCQAMGHRMSYVAADILPDGMRVVGETQYMAFLDKLEQIVSWATP
jgi:hypothetical protein